MRGTIPILTTLLPAALLAIGGCAAGPADLEAASGATAVAGGEGVVDRLAGVRMSAVARAWPGPVAIAREVTPLRLNIENGGDAPVAVRYRNFALVATDGTIYSALPPLGVEGAVSREVEVAPAFTPTFISDDFYVAPYYTAYYPGYSVAADPFYYDPLYYDTYYDYWVDIQLPTSRMLQLALPDGRLEPGGSVTGWLYFEHVDPELERVRFRADVVDAASGRTLGELTMPFAVNGE